MGAFNFSISGDKQAVKRLAFMAQRASNLTPALRSIGEYMLGQTRNRFDSSTDPEGKAWKPLAASTIRAKERSRSRKQKRGAKRLLKKTRANPSDILKDSFLLRDSITYQIESRGQLAIGSPQRYAKFHQLGLGVPKRAFLGVNQADKVEIATILAEHIGRD
jgi:phage virion morphogenesis protein